MKRMTDEEIVKVVQAHIEGKPIEVYGSRGGWIKILYPSWNFDDCVYRVALTKPSVDWSHVDKRFNYLATDSNGTSYFFMNKPIQRSSWWGVQDGECLSADAFASFTPGTCDWTDSLVERPEEMND